jgi:hypothetical protein
MTGRQHIFQENISVSSGAKFRLKQIFNSDLWDAEPQQPVISSLFWNIGSALFIYKKR